MATAASGLNIGVTIEQVIERTTVNAARAIRRNELGNLDEENIADIAVLKLERGRFAFLDSGRGKHIGDKKLCAGADCTRRPDRLGRGGNRRRGMEQRRPLR